jgi:hypothetical protein
MEPQDVEILVHVTAPSRVADDETYRRLARAYLAFQPESRVHIASAAVAVESCSQEYKTPNAEALCAESQELSFQSALDNRSSPRPRPRADGAIKTASQSSWCAPPSQISDSYPLPGAAIINVTPTRVLQRYLQRTPSSSPPSSKDDIIPHASFDAIQIPSSIPIPSSNELPRPKLAKPVNVIPLTPLPDRLQKRALQQEDDAVVDVTHVSNSFVSSPRAESEPPPKITKCITGTAKDVYLARSTSDTGPPRSSDPSAIEFISRSLQIKPPSPPVSVDDLDPTSLVSPKLDKLSRDLSSRYQPAATRQISPFERGYWLVDCTRWPEATRLDTWVFLTNYLRSGLAGWGVWCTRDELHDWMRFYCWGHVAKHIYLLMYLASGRQIKAKGARWFDAEGEAILDMPGLEKK